MRLFKKYKKWLKIKPQNPPIRILNFKRSKWALLKKSFKKSYNLNILNYSKTLILFKFWERKRYFLKNLMLIESQHKAYYNFLLQKKFYKNKKIKKQKAFINSFFYKNELKLNIFLWKLNIFKSIFEANYYIQRRLIKYNNKDICLPNKILKEGDIISFEKINLKKNKKMTTELNNSFFEIDFYTKSIVIIKDTFYFKDSFLIKQQEFPLLLLKKKY
jgi:ribosomal 50S subunit-recycling heat shock protein